MMVMDDEMLIDVTPISNFAGRSKKPPPGSDHSGRRVYGCL
jgi:hypothetical protein